ncbi:SSU0592/SSU0593 family protein [Streptococcus suis]|uniref:SSU0592/SSU0593 family protein n=1 Tax=Streptococcus suis TaxID=1307 RepID=UPI000CF74193|nr:hypothetical protein [Streptococcus suis]
MKQLVTKRSYKIGLSAMALVLLMTTAGGATAHASTDTYSVVTEGETTKYILLENKVEDPFNNGQIKNLSSVNPSISSKEECSWISSLWKGLIGLLNRIFWIE